MKRKLIDVLESNDPIVDHIIDVAIRLYDGCWIYRASGQVDEWGRPWVYSADDELTRADVVMWEWFHGVKVPVGYEVESICGNLGCLNPECLVLWEVEGDGSE